jgi:hypothetical protein
MLLIPIAGVGDMIDYLYVRHLPCWQKKNLRYYLNNDCMESAASVVVVAKKDSLSQMPSM